MDGFDGKRDNDEVPRASIPGELVQMLIEQSRPRVTALIVSDTEVACDMNCLMLARNKFGDSYDSTIGGGVEAGESIWKALVREVFEETGLEITSASCICSFMINGRLHYIFVVKTTHGPVRLGADEVARTQEDNTYELHWRSVLSLDNEDYILRPYGLSLVVRAILRRHLRDASQQRYREKAQLLLGAKSTP